MAMDKYAVEIDPAMEKNAQRGGVKHCQKCGKQLSRTSNVPHCAACGTQPLERHKDTDAPKR